MNGNVEVETTIAVVSESPEDTVAQVLELTSIGPYELTHRNDLEIFDLYLDLAGNVLRSRGFGFRIRNVGGLELLTLKGKPQYVVGGGLSRDELELPWSSESLAAIIESLEQRGVRLPQAVTDAGSRDPLSSLLERGFRVEQRRRTKRRPRDVVLGGKPESKVAELVVDSVEYHFESGHVGHHEIEIEQKGAGTVADIQDVTRRLLSYFPDILQEWHFGKRSTGRAAEALVAERGPGGLVSASGNLLPEAYDLIRARLD